MKQYHVSAHFYIEANSMDEAAQIAMRELVMPATAASGEGLVFRVDTEQRRQPDYRKTYFVCPSGELSPSNKGEIGRTE